MSIKDFSNPNVKIVNDKELQDYISNICLDFWEQANNKCVKEDKKFNSESEILTAMISMYIGFLQITHGDQNALILLDEISRRIRSNIKNKNSLH